MQTIDDTTSNKCLNCGSVLQGKYCHNCGLKVIDPKDKSLKKMAGDFFSNMFLLESKFLGSLKILITRPSILPSTYISGITNRFLKPIQFFLIFNLIYFIFPIAATFNTSFNVQVNGLPYSNYVKPVIYSHLNENEISEEEYINDWNRTSNKAAKLIVIILVPLFGIFFYLLNFNKDNFYLADHFAVSLYFLSFIFLLFIVLLPLIGWASNFLPLDWVWSDDEFFITAFILSIISFYMFFVFRGVYGKKKLQSIVSSILVAAVFIPFLYIFRFILFVVTFLSLSYFS